MRLTNSFFFLFILLFPLLGYTQTWQLKSIDRMPFAQKNPNVKPTNRNQKKTPAKEIKRLLMLAERQLDRMQLTLPIRNNAYETYQQVLKIDPNNDEARRGLLKIADRYEKLAERYAEKGLLRKSLRFVKRGLRVVPDHGGLIDLYDESVWKELDIKGNSARRAMTRSKPSPTQPMARSEPSPTPQTIIVNAKSSSRRLGGRLGSLTVEFEEEQQLIKFPWPPPRASATETIARELLEVKQKSPVKTLLRDIDSKITKSLKQTGYYESSYYAAPKGFAIATRIEQIEEDGSPKKGPQRWSLESQPIDEFTLTAYIRALFLSKPGYYRVIVFVVTPYPLTQSSVDTTPEEAKKWLSGGHNRLPESIENMEFLKTYTCTALIYEFERQTESEEPRFRQPGRIPGHTHLMKAGIWRSLEQ